jgi:hypothetical protein
LPISVGSTKYRSCPIYIYLMLLKIHRRYWDFDLENGKKMVVQVIVIALWNTQIV